MASTEEIQKVTTTAAADLALSDATSQRRATCTRFGAMYVVLWTWESELVC